MKGKPQIHFWKERVGALENGPPGPGYIGTTIYAVSACRDWDLPANGVFMLFMHDECHDGHGRDASGKYFYIPPKKDWRRLLTEKLEAREKALVNWYGRSAKHHLADFALTPSERQALTRQRESQAAEA
jgi:hypothetical protein